MLPRRLVWSRGGPGRTESSGAWSGAGVRRELFVTPEPPELSSTVQHCQDTRPHNTTVSQSVSQSNKHLETKFFRASC